MENAWQQVQPKDTFVVRSYQPLTAPEQEVTNFLYQPLLGSEAFSLWINLLAELPTGCFESNVNVHAELLNRMEIGIPQFFQARIKLEGIGLLKTYVKKEEINQDFLYVLQKPLSASDFFHDEVLSVFLLEKVGEKRYNQLVDLFAVPNASIAEDYQEVSRKFLDVFPFKLEKLQAYQAILQQSQALFITDESKVELKVESTTFDWTYFMSLIDGIYINKEQVETKLRKTIYTFHQLYGIDELAMQRFLLEATDYLTNRVDEKELRKAIYKQYHQPRKNQAVVAAAENAAVTEENQSVLEPAEQAILRQNTLKRLGFTEQEIQIILISESLSPMDFLQSIKEQKGGYVAQSERWTLESICKNANLPNAVINILLHYALVTQDNAVLNQRYAEAIANDWAQKKIFKPEDAILEAKKLQQAAKEKKQKRQADKKQNHTSYKGNQVTYRKETLPEWATKEPILAETPLPEEKLAALKERLNRK